MSKNICCFFLFYKKAKKCRIEENFKITYSTHLVAGNFLSYVVQIPADEKICAVIMLALIYSKIEVQTPENFYIPPYSGDFRHVFAKVVEEKNL